MIDQPMRMQQADPNKMPCRDCLYRDKTEMTLEGEKVRVGLTRDTCLFFDGKNGRWKPSNVYFLNEPCPMYEWDETAERFWEGKK